MVQIAGCSYYRDISSTLMGQVFPWVFP